MRMTPYLTFNGNCHEAMIFYHRCIGGKLFFQTLGDDESLINVPQVLTNRIVYASLVKGDFKLSATDLIPESNLIQGNTVSLLLDCSSYLELMEIFTNLSEGAREISEPVVNASGVLFGNIIDKYGKSWLFSFSGN